MAKPTGEGPVSRISGDFRRWIDCVSGTRRCARPERAGGRDACRRAHGGQSLGVLRKVKDTSMQRSLFSTLIVAGALSVTSIALANDLDVPVTEEAGDGQMANCSSAMVSGLKANGDGFLAVRSGPGSQYRKIDELHDGETVLDFDRHGKWAGIVYRSPNAHCHSISTKRHPVTYEKKGWVHTKWLKPVAN